MPQAAAIEVQAFFRGILIDVGYVLTLEAGRGRRRRPRRAHRHDYRIGPGRDAHAPVDRRYTSDDVDRETAPGASSLPSFLLVEALADAFLVHTTPAMDGEVTCAGRATALAAWVSEWGASFVLTESVEARVECGETSFTLRGTSAPSHLPRPPLVLRWRDQRYTALSSVALALTLLVAWLIPPEVEAVSFDLYGAHLRFTSFLITPPEPKKPPADAGRGAGGGHPAPQQAGQRHAGPEGASGKPTSRARDRRLAIRGQPGVTDPHLAQQPVDEIKTSGILGVLQTRGGLLASVLGRDSALGEDGADVLAELTASPIGEAYGIGGLALVGTGAAGGGTGQGTIGLGRLGTIGDRGGDRRGALGPRGRGDGLPGHRAIAPDFLAGQPVVRGALDKEIIRRIIRRHINEVRFCYEQELGHRQDLAGRVAVNFTIAPTGLVAAALLQSSSLANPRVEGCIVGAVKRWEFPRPEGGGLVIATYPFNFTSAGH